MIPLRFLALGCFALLLDRLFPLNCLFWIWVVLVSLPFVLVLGTLAAVWWLVATVCCQLGFLPE